MSGAGRPRAGPGPPPADLAELLADRLADYRAGVYRCARSGIATAVATALAGSRRVVVPADLPAAWLAAYRGDVVRDRVDALLPLTALDAPAVSVVTGCAIAIASTGTVILDAGAAQGRRALTLVPDHHVCVVDSGQIVASVPEGLAALADPTRPVTLISGPSATSDIELERVEGVHGPRGLDVIIIGDPTR
jgi:L-lactate dehydrogenase complex protein LldG